MTFADKLRDLLKQPQGEKKVEEYIREVLADPNTRHEVAEITNLQTSNEVPKTL
ncbi:hypothetical protein [Pseudomonas sp. MS15a(2019)]|uniref:hypothetical protein n=1 Tax=Pseudomonas sp. MS15a(2019) TaxID=2579938 RepID=UPI001567157A|nr:hypothetical protein [Pseudomonas sp. MS15a(2019)]